MADDKALRAFYEDASEEGTLWFLYMYLRDYEGWSAEQFSEKIVDGLRQGEFGLYVYGPSNNFVKVEFEPKRTDIKNYWLTLNFDPNDLTLELFNKFYERVRAGGEA